MTIKGAFAYEDSAVVAQIAATPISGIVRDTLNSNIPQFKGIAFNVAGTRRLISKFKLDFGITDIVYEWAQGESLSQVLYGTELTGGDFVRNCKRLADVLQQIAVSGPYLAERAETLPAIARQAYDRINRGIVAYSGVD